MRRGGVNVSSERRAAEGRARVFDRVQGWGGSAHKERQAGTRSLAGVDDTTASGRRNASDTQILLLETACSPTDTSREPDTLHAGSAARRAQPDVLCKLV